MTFDFTSVHFPYQPRPVQEAMVQVVWNCVNEKKHAVIHAPTGMGKTVATLAPALTMALQRDLVVFFLTGRHTQHQIAIRTLREIKQKYNLDFKASSIIGKQWMCLQGGVDDMRSDDFASYCKALRERRACDYYENSKTGMLPSIQAQAAVEEVEQPATSEGMKTVGSQKSLCPYELALMLASQSKVIIADYYYLFNKGIRETFLGKIGRKLEQAIIIVDEGHNLPHRLRELLTARLSSKTMRFAIKEAKALGMEECLNLLVEIQDALTKTAGQMFAGEERIVSKADFSNRLEAIMPLEEMLLLLESAAEDAATTKKRSTIGSVAMFLRGWNQEGTGFSRMATMHEFGAMLTNRCLDPSMASREVINSSYCTVLMSGTLTPTAMYADLLGFPSASVQQSFPSPFPGHNKQCIIIPKTTTKYAKRDEAQFRAIAEMCAGIVNKIPGSTAIFFPSYALRDAVNAHFATACYSTIFLEQPELTKQEKQDTLDRFKSYQKACLLGVASGSFGEGIDLPGVLKAVLVVGLPLDRPNLETNELIAYYDRLYRKGWDYGYVLPAITRTLQNAGRCIRTETDRGMLFFIDERYVYPAYRNCFPTDWKITIMNDASSAITAFFSENEKPPQYT